MSHRGNGRVVTLVELQRHCREVGLSGFKVPRLAVPLQQLPVNSTGKVVKALVKDAVGDALVTQEAVMRSRL